MAIQRVAGAVARAEDEALDRVEAALLRRALAGDVRAAALILAARRPEVWRRPETEDDAGDVDGEWQAIAERMAQRLESRDGTRATPRLPPPASETAGTPSPAGPAPAGVPSSGVDECPPLPPEPDAPPSGQSD